MADVILKAALHDFRILLQAQMAARQADDLVAAAPLYHYTDAAGLTAMVQNEAIWFTDYRHLNDPQEMHYGLWHAHEVILELMKGATPLGEYFLELLNHQLSLSIENSFNDPDKLEFFVACFSRNSDDLGQWRAYAANGRGFALGMAPENFQPNALPGSHLDEMTIASKVVYGETDGKARHRVVIASALEFVKGIEGHLASTPSRRDFEEFIRSLIQELLAGALIVNCITSKHEAYDREEEVRLVIMGQRLRLFPYIRTRVRGHEIVPYIEYPVRFRTAKGVITDIVAGPAAHPDSERTMRTFVEKCTVFPPPDIRRSTVPYRPTT